MNKPKTEYELSVKDLKNLLDRELPSKGLLRTLLKYY
jgi:hypothetical protein